MLSIFDIIGPIMIGPSSSHTAGAVRIGEMARTIFKGPIERVTIGLHGSYAATGEGHGTRAALVAGLLGMAADDTRIPEAREIAKQSGLDAQWREARLGPEAHPNSVTIEMAAKDRTMRIQAASIGGGRAMINAIDGCPVEIAGDLPTIVLFHADEVGVLAGITGRLAAANINIAHLRTYRREGSRRAVTEIATDERVPGELTQDLEELPPVERVIYLAPMG